MFKVFVVDDETIARGNIIDALSHHNQWAVLSSFSSGKGVVENALKLQPDVIFLDIQMPGENGMTVAKQLLKLAQPPLIVFVTAFSEYAVNAFELYAVDYLLKPFDDKRLAQCIDKLEHALSNTTKLKNKLDSQNAWAAMRPLKQLIIRSSASIRVIPCENIEWIGANGNYVDIHHQGLKHLMRGTFKHVLSCLEPSEFVQIHRAHAVRISLIREIKTLEDDKNVLQLSTGQQLPIGKAFKGKLLELFVNEPHR